MRRLLFNLKLVWACLKSLTRTLWWYLFPLLLTGCYIEHEVENLPRPLYDENGVATGMLGQPNSWDGQLFAVLGLVFLALLIICYWEEEGRHKHRQRKIDRKWKQKIR